MQPQILTRILIGVSLLCTSVGAAEAPHYSDLQAATVNYTALQPGQQAVVAIVLDIKPGFHAQSHTPSSEDYIKFEANIVPITGITFYPPIYPAGQNELYKTIDAKPLNVYTGKVTVYVPFMISEPVKPGPLKISGKLAYQVCDDNQCYFPTKTPFSIETQVVPLGQAVQAQQAELFKGFDPTYWARLPAVSTNAPAAVSQPEGQKLFGGIELKHNSYLLAYFAAFLAGIIFNAVPCVLPVLPLKAIGFYEVSQHNRAKCIAFGAVFSLGLIASFAALALIVVVYRVVGWGEIYSNIYFNIAIVAILLIMAVGTFGFFTINLPTAVYNITPRHDTYLGNFLFGILTAVLSTPCTFGLFLGLLVWTVDQPAAIGMTLVMTVGAGMASPYFVLSAFPGLARKFPRTGPWSDVVKQMMAFLLLGSAVFFARRFIQPFTGDDAFWWVLFALSVIAGVFLIGRSIQLTPKLRPRLVCLVIAVLLMGGTFIVVLKIVSQPYTWTPYSPQALKAAQDSKRVVVVEFTATWCSTCKYLEVATLHNPTVVSEVKRRNVEMLSANLTAESASGWPLLKQLSEVAAIPFTAVYGPGASEPIKLRGIYSPENLQDAIEQAAKINVAQPPGK